MTGWEHVIHDVLVFVTGAGFGAVVVMVVEAAIGRRLWGGGLSSCPPKKWTGRRRRIS